MSKFYGSMVTAVENGGTIVDKIKSYDNYEEMVNDSNSGRYGICKDTNTVWHKTDNGWVVGFANIERDDYYTAFEVLPTTEKFSAGDIEIDGIANPAYIDPCTLERIIIRSTKPMSECDVVIDWGDGEQSKIANGDADLDLERFSTALNEALHGGTADPDYVYNEEDFGLECQYVLEHDYANALAAAGETHKRFTVKIFGKDYYGVKQSHGVNGVEDVIPASNLMCRVFAQDLPIASHLTNFSSFCYKTLRLFSVDFTNTTILSRANNFANCFSGCSRMVQLTGFGPCSNDIRAIGNLFKGCTQLQYTDFRLPNMMQTTAGFTRVFNSCKKLAVDVIDLLPLLGFTFDKCSVYSTFRDCANLYCSDPDRLGELLWNNTRVDWTSPSTAFAGCSDELRQYVPKSWGGTASDDIIEKSDAEKIAELTARLEALENN